MSDRQPRDSLTMYGTMSQEIDLSNVAAFKAEDPAAIMRLYSEYLTAAFVFIKSGMVFEINNPTLHQACDRLSKVANFIFQQLEGNASIHFLSDGVYVNRNLLKVQGTRFEQGEYLTQIFNSLGVGSMSLQGVTSREDWLDLIRQFHKLVRGESLHTDLTALRLPNIVLHAPENSEGGDAAVAVTDRFRTLRGYSVAVISLRQSINQLQHVGELRLVSLKRSLLELAAVSEDCRDMLVGLLNLKRHKVDLGHHLINTAALVMIMCKDLGVSRKETLELVMQAALHDIGRCLLPESTGQYDVIIEERRRAQETIGQVARSLAIFERTAMRVAVANEVRMWVDRKKEVNEGYQFDLTAPSRIIAVAHAYDLLTTPTKHRGALLPDEALQVIYAEAGSRYDEAAARVLVNVLGVFPVGSVVQLSNGQTAIVVESPQGGDPTRPRVKVIKDVKGKVVDGGFVDLQKAQDKQIVKCLDAEENKVNIPAFLLG